MKSDALTAAGAVIIPHVSRPERRAVHHPGLRMIRYEYLDCRGDWIVDYTTYESAAQTDYFREFYGAGKGKQ